MTTSASSEKMQHLMRLVQKLRTDRNYMASLLAIYQVQERLDEIELANRLSMNVIQIPRLALCKRPLPGSKDFTEQVRQIASYTGADASLLAQIIRQVEILEHFHALPAVDEAETKKRSFASSSGLLTAARDNEDLDNRSISDDKPNDNNEKAS